MRKNSEINAESRDSNRQNYEEILDLFAEYLEKKYKFSQEEIESFTGKITEPKIPVTIFNKKLGALETITKFLIENKSLRKKDVAALLNRDTKTIWSTYEKAKKKHPKPFEKQQLNTYKIPVNNFRNRKFSTLEIIVIYLREHYKLSFKEISTMIHRSAGTLGTVYFRANKKRGELETQQWNKDAV